MGVILAIGNTIWESRVGRRFQVFLPWTEFLSSAVFSGFLTFWSYVIILNTVVPISLYVRYSQRTCTCRQKSYISFNHPTYKWRNLSLSLFFSQSINRINQQREFLLKWDPTTWWWSQWRCHHGSFSSSMVTLFKQWTSYFEKINMCKLYYTMSCMTFPSVWRFCGSVTVTSSTGTRECTTVRRTRQLWLAPPAWTRSWARCSSSSPTRPAPSPKTSWCSASAPLMDRRMVRSFVILLNNLYITVWKCIRLAFF